MGRFATVIATAAILAAAAGVAIAAQKAPPPVFTPAAGAEMGLNLYPITKFRGAPEVVTQDTPRIRRPIAAESAIVLRGVWEVCSDINYGGRCVQISETHPAYPVALQVRSARLIGDNGANYADSTLPKGPSILGGGSVAAVTGARSMPAPVVAPTVAAGGLAGDNPSLKGQGVEFFAAPARSGVRVLACAAGTASNRCVTATADGFCVEKGYRTSSTRDVQMAGGKAYLANVLCKSDSDPSTNGNVKSRGFLGIGR